MKYIFGKIKSVKKIYSECKEILQLVHHSYHPERQFVATGRFDVVG